MNITFIGFGEAGRAFAESLLVQGDHAITAYDRLDDDAMCEAMTSRGIRRATSPAEAVSGADWIISAVTADQSLAAAESVADALEQRQVFFDINSVSPDRKRETAKLVDVRAAHYVDMAVMAPVHPQGHATPVLIAGPNAPDLAEALAQAGFSFEVVGETAGEATAVKMVRSLFVKGLEAITVEAALAAAASGCFDRVMASLEKTYPGLGWPDNVSYNFERTLRHGARRASEMRESAATLDALGLSGDLGAEIAAVQDRMGALPTVEVPDGTLEEAALAILQMRRS
ncbi:3-hydroxyisobutyrate dehydrogenase [Palleronia marisminoris]|uniref:Tartronate semialdehyde reductase n=1 Tax=Palleronia marisminoris TaxID=315423 RepID=A0A1Y5TM64_9RHOB|nr:DUF1932 domain-containing protein [Palleronia marisminoris]SFH42391.1 3-hydroxyisobutyrate dehydrogenase [Palleronia marisminoris]SLN65491.1 tartronate semialdehyde reductase [Palleronia marisminoris]